MMALDSGYWEVGEQIDLHSTMQPIIKLAMADFETQLEGTIIMCCVHKVGVDVDKERLVQALTDAQRFWDEGYRAGALRQSEPRCVRREGGLTKDGHWRPERKYCPVCGKQQKNSKYGQWYCERCGQKLCKDGDTRPT